MRKLSLFLLLSISFPNLYAQAIDRMNSVSDVKMVLSQCSARYAFNAALIKAGVILIRDNRGDEMMAKSAKLSREFLSIANRLPGPTAQVEAERFYEILKAALNQKPKNSEGAKQAMDESFAAVDKCSEYVGHPKVLRLVKDY